MSLVLGLLLAALTPTLHLEWKAPQGCPDRDWELAEVQRLRGDLAVRDGAAGEGLVARVALAAEGDRWRADVRTESRGVPGQRTVISSTCERAAASAAV